MRVYPRTGTLTHTPMCIYRCTPAPYRTTATSPATTSCSGSTGPQQRTPGSGNAVRISHQRLLVTRGWCTQLVAGHASIFFHFSDHHNISPDRSMGDRDSSVLNKANRAGLTHMHISKQKSWEVDLKVRLSPKQDCDNPVVSHSHLLVRCPRP